MKDREETMAQVRKRYALVREALDERGRRQVVAAQALAVGWGAVLLVAGGTWAGGAARRVSAGVGRQCAGWLFASGVRRGDLGGWQEEGTGRRCPERRAGGAAQGGARGGAGVRLPDQGAGQGDALRGV